MPDNQENHNTIDYERLGREVAKNLDVHCKMGWKQEDIQTLSELASSIRGAKKSALSAIVYLIIVTLAGLLLAGTVVRLKALDI